MFFEIRAFKLFSNDAFIKSRLFNEIKNLYYSYKTEKRTWKSVEKPEKWLFQLYGVLQKLHELLTKFLQECLS